VLKSLLKRDNLTPASSANLPRHPYMVGPLLIIIPRIRDLRNLINIGNPPRDLPFGVLSLIALSRERDGRGKEIEGEREGG